MNNILKLVQDYELKSGITLKEKLESDYATREKGWRIEDNEVVFYVSPTRELSKNPLTSPDEIKWRVEGNKIIPVSGKSSEYTPELDEKLMEIEKRKRSVPKNNLRIYNFVEHYMSELDKSEEESLEAASKEFNLSVNEIDAIHLKVQNTIYTKE